MNKGFSRSGVAGSVQDETRTSGYIESKEVIKDNSSYINGVQRST